MLHDVTGQPVAADDAVVWPCRVCHAECTIQSAKHLCYAFIAEEVAEHALHDTVLHWLQAGTLLHACWLPSAVLLPR